MSVGNLPDVVSYEEWLAARKELLAKEKELTRLRDQVNADRRRLPMIRVTKPYTFVGPNGRVGLLDLFEGRRQLVVHHFMWINDIDAEGNVRNTTLVAVTRAPHEKIAAFRERMGWTFPWYSSYDSDFNYDFHVTVDDRVAPVQIWYRTESEMAETSMPWTKRMRGDWPGISAFLQVDGEVYHTYSTYGRGIEEFHNGYHYLDLTALGRQEAWEEPKGRAVPLGLQVGGRAMRLPDEYDT
jgi:predicted dithiol-disulfide oxidoreductase (DUF899 family)